MSEIVKTQSDSTTVARVLLLIFNGGSGFGLILYFWALMGALISAITLVTASLIYWNWWVLFLGLFAAYSYFYLGRLGRNLLDKILPFDGQYFGKFPGIDT